MIIHNSAASQGPRNRMASVRQRARQCHLNAHDFRVCICSTLHRGLGCSMGEAWPGRVENSCQQHQRFAPHASSPVSLPPPPARPGPLRSCSILRSCMNSQCVHSDRVDARGRYFAAIISKAAVLLLGLRLSAATCSRTADSARVRGGLLRGGPCLSTGAERCLKSPRIKAHSCAHGGGGFAFSSAASTSRDAMVFTERDFVSVAAIWRSAIFA